MVGIAGNTFIDSSKGGDTAKVGMPDGREERASTIIYVAGHELELPAKTEEESPKFRRPCGTNHLEACKAATVTLSNYQSRQSSIKVA